MISNGIDLIKIDRLKNVINKETFFTKNFSNKELAYIKSCNQNISTIAGIFAAKEAFLKALKKGIDAIPLKDIEINHDKNNAPYISIPSKYLKDISVKNIALSISHDTDYAIAMVSIIY